MAAAPERPAMGFDIGGTKTEVIVLAPGGAELHRRREPTPQAYEELVALVRTLAFDMDRAVGATCSVGVGAPGSPNPGTGLHRNSNLTSMNGRPFQSDVSSELGRAVRVGNDANCMTLSEAVDGAGEGHVVFGVILGTGVGGGVVVGKQVVEGRHGIGGEWGHNPMPGVSDAEIAAAPCYCGRCGCIEQFLAGPAIERRYRAATGVRVPARDLPARAAVGDAAARESLDWHAEGLARALGTIVNVLDPHHIVLAGGLSNIPGLAERVQTELPQHAFSDECTTRVVRAKHGDSSGVRGAAWLGRTAH